MSGQLWALIAGVGFGVSISPVFKTGRVWLGAPVIIGGSVLLILSR